MSQYLWYILCAAANSVVNAGDSAIALPGLCPGKLKNRNCSCKETVQQMFSYLLRGTDIFSMEANSFKTVFGSLLKMYLG